MMLVTFITDLEYLHKGEVTQRSVTLASLNVVLVLGSCSSWWPIGLCFRTAVGPLELYSGVTNTA